MTDELGNAILKELKRLNGFMEAVDWKLWNIHQKYIETNASINTPRTTKSTEPASSTEAAIDSVISEVVAPAIPKYPSIQKWS